MRKKLLLVLPILLLSLVLVGCGNTANENPALESGEGAEEGVPMGGGVVTDTTGTTVITGTTNMTGTTGTETTPGEVQVSMENIQFNPPEITVPAGTTVVWTNMDQVVHTVTSGTRDNPDGLFDSGDIPAGGTFSYTFDQPGTYPYFCVPHAGMEGTVIVE